MFSLLSTHDSSVMQALVWLSMVLLSASYANLRNHHIFKHQIWGKILSSIQVNTVAESNRRPHTTLLWDPHYHCILLCTLCCFEIHTFMLCFFEIHTFALCCFEIHTVILFCIEIHTSALCCVKNHTCILCCFEIYALTLCCFEIHTITLFCFEIHILALCCFEIHTLTLCCFEIHTLKLFCLLAVASSCITFQLTGSEVEMAADPDPDSMESPYTCLVFKTGRWLLIATITVVNKGSNNYPSDTTIYCENCNNSHMF